MFKDDGRVLLPFFSFLVSCWLRNIPDVSCLFDFLGDGDGDVVQLPYACPGAIGIDVFRFYQMLRLVTMNAGWNGWNEGVCCLYCSRSRKER